MCIICLDFVKNQDIKTAKEMIAAAKREPGAVDPGHLSDIEKHVSDYEEMRDWIVFLSERNRSIFEKYDEN